MEWTQWINWGFWLFINLVATGLIFIPAFENRKVFKRNSAYYHSSAKRLEGAKTTKLMAWIFAFGSLFLTCAVALSPLSLMAGKISVLVVTGINWFVVILNAFESNQNASSQVTR